MIVRLASLGFIAWILGFAWFGAFLPQPLDGRATDAIVVLTGELVDDAEAKRAVA